MKLHLVCIGKLKSSAEKTIAADYVARINQLARSAGLKGLHIHEWPESQRESAAQRMKDEATVLAKSTPPGAVTIVFDERGKSLTSESFAGLLRKYTDASQADLVFLVGGPDGHAATTRENANHVIALGTMTWPHRLARIMILEQLYRAVTIMLNHPYHRS